MCMRLPNWIITGCCPIGVAVKKNAAARSFARVSQESETVFISMVTFSEESKIKQDQINLKKTTLEKERK